MDDSYKICIANETYIDKLVQIGIESDTETCPIEIISRINSKNSFYTIALFEDNIIGKCLIKKGSLTSDDDINTYYLREVYKNKLHYNFKMINLLSYAINYIPKRNNITLKLFVNISNSNAIRLYNKLNFNIIYFNNSIYHTNEYIEDKTYNRDNLVLNGNLNEIQITDHITLTSPDKNFAYHKFMLKID